MRVQSHARHQVKIEVEPGFGRIGVHRYVCRIPRGGIARLI